MSAHNCDLVSHAKTEEKKPDGSPFSNFKLPDVVGLDMSSSTCTSMEMGNTPVV